MVATAPDFRILVMTWVQASWEEAGGQVQTVSARMEDKSTGGACIRIKTSIQVGAKLRIQWRFEQFSGTAKYCRKDGIEYLVGIQRDAIAKDAFNLPLAPARSTEPAIAANASSVSVPQTSDMSEDRIPKSIGMAIVERTGASAVNLPAVIVEIDLSNKAPAQDTDDANSARSRDPDGAASIRLRTKIALEKTKEGRKPMRHKWLELSPWGDKQNIPGATPHENSDDERDGKSNCNFSKEPFMSNPNRSLENASVHSAREVPSFQVDLLPMEDIYRAAGIMEPRKGYSIIKVVGMLHSEHLRETSKETKRAAVLTALDAAGVPVSQIQQDAKARQDALDSHEAEQKHQVEAEWARKAEEVIQIQAELESINAHYAARISRSVEGVAREKTTFNGWVELKQQESQNMAEAVELCLKPPLPEPVPVSPPDVALSKAAASIKQEPVNGTIQ